MGLLDPYSIYSPYTTYKFTHAIFYSLISPLPLPITIIIYLYDPIVSPISTNRPIHYISPRRSFGYTGMVHWDHAGDAFIGSGWLFVDQGRQWPSRIGVAPAYYSRLLPCNWAAHGLFKTPALDPRVEIGLRWVIDD